MADGSIILAEFLKNFNRNFSPKSRWFNQTQKSYPEKLLSANFSSNYNKIGIRDFRMGRVSGMEISSSQGLKKNLQKLANGKKLFPPKG